MLLFYLGFRIRKILYVSYKCLIYLERFLHYNSEEIIFAIEVTVKEAIL